MFTGPGGRNNNNDVVDDQNLEVMTSESEDSNKSSALSSPSSSNATAIPSHPGCRGGHQMVINSDNQVSELLLIFGHFGNFLGLFENFWKLQPVVFQVQYTQGFSRPQIPVYICHYFPFTIKFDPLWLHRNISVSCFVLNFFRYSICLVAETAIEIWLIVGLLTFLLRNGGCYLSKAQQSARFPFPVLFLPFLNISR